jgi:hypothetical protein
MELLRKYRVLKNFMRLPAILTLSLINYISYVFLRSYLPFKYPDYCLTYFLIVAIFGYLSAMTSIFLLMAFCSHPGYLPARLEMPKEEGKAPKELRLFRMENYMRNGLHDFEKEMREPTLRRENP